MITYHEEMIVDNVNSLMSLIELHYEEVESIKELVKKPNPDWVHYIALEEAGVIQLCTVRNDGELVGYITSLIMPSLHYKDFTIAMNDAIFIKKEYRGRLAGMELIKFAESKLKAAGVNVSYIQTKIAHDFGPILERSGYTDIERVFEKVIS